MLKTKRTALLILSFLLLLAGQSFAWSGKVVGVADGDTITVMHDGKGEKIRLYGIDSPEKHQDYGTKAKQFTSDMVFGNTVEVKPADTDRYGRTVGLVYLKGKCVNEEIIRAGFAWVYEKYCKQLQCIDWKKLERLAQAARVGLWAGSHPIPPWEFRHSSGNPGHQGAVKLGSQPATAGEYHGNVSSKLFHKSTCQQFNCKNCTAVFKSRDEAIAAGYRPCRDGNPNSTDSGPETRRRF